jgi:hypothetical protein
LVLKLKQTAGQRESKPACPVYARKQPSWRVTWDGRVLARTRSRRGSALAPLEIGGTETLGEPALDRGACRRFAYLAARRPLVLPARKERTERRDRVP